MSKPIIAIDVDDTLAVFAKDFCRFHDQKYHTNINLDDVKSFTSNLNLGVSSEEFMNRIFEFYNTEAFTQIQPTQGAQQAVDQIKHDFDLIVITSRPTFIKDKTITWLDTHFPNSFKDIILTNQYSKDPSQGTTKKQVCQDHNASFFIDDAIEYAQACSQVCDVYLYTQPWNRFQPLPHNTQRVNTWEEITNHLSSIIST